MIRFFTWIDTHLNTSVPVMCKIKSSVKMVQRMKWGAELDTALTAIIDLKGEGRELTTAERMRLCELIVLTHSMTRKEYETRKTFIYTAQSQVHVTCPSCKYDFQPEWDTILRGDRSTDKKMYSFLLFSYYLDNDLTPEKPCLNFNHKLFNTNYILHFDYTCSSCKLARPVYVNICGHTFCWPCGTTTNICNKHARPVAIMPNTLITMRWD